MLKYGEQPEQNLTDFKMLLTLIGVPETLLKPEPQIGQLIDMIHARSKAVAIASQKAQSFEVPEDTVSESPGSHG